MSGGFFRGTSADQDTRFSNKQAKLLKSQKFAPELEHLVDMTKVQMDVIRPWIANRATELLGFEDEVLINFIYGLLDGKAVDGKKVQIQLTGFMEKNTGKFMKELWILLLSAQKNISGIPQQFLDAKEEETKKKNAEADRIATELQKRKEKEGMTMFEQEKHNRTDGEFAKEDTDSNSRQCAPRDSDAYSKEEKKRERHGSRQKNGISMSTKSDDHSLSHQGSPSEIRESKSFSNSRSYSDGRGRSKSISTSPLRRRRSISIDQHHRSPPRQTTPIRGKHSLGNTRSPMRRYSPLSLHQNRSPQKHKSRSPQRHTSRSPRRYRNRSPRRYRSPSPRRYRSPPSRRYRSPSPRRYRSPSPRRYRSPSPRRLKSPSPRRYRSPKSRFSNSNRRRSFSPQQMFPLSRRSLSLSLEKSPSPLRRRSPFLRKRSLSPNVSPSPRLRSPSPLQQRSPSQQQRSISPQGRSPSSKQWKSSIPLKRSSSPPLRKSPSLQWRRSSSLTRDRSLSPPRKRSPFLQRRRSPPPQRQRSPRPRQRSPHPRRRSSPPQRQRSLSPQQRSFPLRRSQSPRKRLSSPAKKRLQSPRFSKQEKTLVRSSKRGHSPDESNSPHGYQRASSRDHGDYDNDKEPIIYRDGYAFQRSWEKSSPVHHSSIRKGVDRPTSSGDVSKHPLISLRSPQRDSKENNDPHYKQSPSPKHSSIFSRSPSPKHSISSDVEVRSVSPSLSSEKRPKVRSDRHDSSDTNRKLSHSRSDLSRKNVKQATIIQDQKRPSSSLDQEGYSSDSIHAIQSVEVQRRVRARKNENDQRRNDTSHTTNEIEYGPERQGMETIPSDHGHEKNHSSSLASRLENSRRKQHLSSNIEYDDHCQKTDPLRNSKRMDKNDRINNIDSIFVENEKHKSSNLEKRRHKRHGSEELSFDEKKDAKKRKKDEKRLRKEERRRKREERHRRREEKRSNKLKIKSVDTVTPPPDFQRSGSDDKHSEDVDSKKGIFPNDIEEMEFDQKKLEIELRNKALESLRAKKGITQ